AQAADRLGPAHAGQAHVDHGGVEPAGALLERRERALAVGARERHRVPAEGERGFQRRARPGVVFDQQDFHDVRSAARAAVPVSVTRVPAPGVDVIASAPPSAVACSSRLRRPRPRATVAGSKPAPSSAISSRSGASDRETRMEAGLPWRTALVTPSSTILAIW